MGEIEEAEGGGLCLVSPPAAEGELEALSASLGIEVRRVAPGASVGDPVAALAGARAVVLEWDLGRRTALDWLELLVPEPRLRGVPIAVCSDAPSRPRVEAALRHGAATFLHRPLDPEELALRLGLDRDPAARQAEHSADAGEKPAVDEL